jgi:hypothetical protein
MGKAMNADNTSEYRCLAVIYLTGENYPHTAINCADTSVDPDSKVGNKFSFFPSEEEVLCLPFFTFMVLNITKEK